MRHTILAAILLVFVAGTARAQLQDEAAAINRLAQEAQARQASSRAPADSLERTFAWLASAWASLGSGHEPGVTRSPQELLAAFQAPTGRLPAEPGSRQP